MATIIPGMDGEPFLGFFIMIIEESTIYKYKADDWKEAQEWFSKLKTNSVHSVSFEFTLSGITILCDDRS